MAVGGAFRFGITGSIRFAAAWLPLFLSHLLIGLLFSLPIYSRLADLLNHRPWAERLLTLYPVDMNFYIELLGIQAYQPGLDVPLPQLLLAFAAGMPLQAAAYAFFSGGYLAALLPTPSADSYLASCMRLFVPFLLLSGLLFAIFLLFALPALLLAAGSANDPLAWVAAGSLLTIGYLLWNGAGEYARVSMVADTHRSPVRAALRGYSFVFSRLPAVLALGLLLGGLAALLFVLLSLAAALVPQTALLAALILSQVRALIAVWMKAIRLAAAAGLYRAYPAEPQHAARNGGSPTGAVLPR